MAAGNPQPMLPPPEPKYRPGEVKSRCRWIHGPRLGASWTRVMSAPSSTVRSAATSAADDTPGPPAGSGGSAVCFR